MFVNMAQLIESALGGSSIVVIRTVDDPVSYVETLRSAARDEDARIALDGVMTIDERVGRSLARPRVYAVLLGGFAVFALIDCRRRIIRRACRTASRSARASSRCGRRLARADPPSSASR